MKVRKLKIEQEAKHGYDIALIFVTLFLCVFGLIMIYSASYYTAQLKGFSGDYYFRLQLRYTLIGLVFMLAVSLIPYNKYPVFAIPIYLLSIVFMILTNYTSLGITAGGRTRWLHVGSVFSFQPAEVVKVGVIMLSAFLVMKYGRKLKGWQLKVLVMALALPPILLVFSNDLSSAIIIFTIPLVMILVVNRNPRFSFIVGALLVIFLIAALWMKFTDLDNLMDAGDWLVAHTPLKEYQVRRLYVWNDPTYDAQGDGYQVLQGLYAIGSGGVFGKGLGASTQKLGFVPEARNDMIFAILCEELGLFGALCLMLLYLFMLYRMLRIAQRADDGFGSLIVVGIMTQIALQAILHIGVVCNLVPNTGISLPFVSYGGSSSIFLLGEIGMVLSVARGERRRQ